MVGDFLTGARLRLRTGTRWWLAAVLVAALAMGAAPAQAASPGGEAAPAARAGTALPALQPLSEVLRADGTIDPAKGSGASLDAEGYRMRPGPDGEPTFVPSAQADQHWATAFGNPSLGTDVLTVAVSGDDVYVGGTFFYSTAGMASGTYNRIAHWDGTGWRRLGTGVNDAVRAIAVVGDDVYVGGDFTTAGSVAASRLARWDGATWHAVAWGVSAPDSSSEATVNALASDGTRLFVGGVFTRAGSVAARSLAALQLSSGAWSALGGGAYRCAECSSDDPGQVRALLLTGTTLFVGGNFDRISGQATHSLASMSTTSGAWTRYGGGVSDDGYKGTVHTLAADASTGTVFIGGSFTSAGTVPSWNLATLRGGTFGTLGGVSMYGGKYATVSALAFAGGRLYAGGDFTAIGNLAGRHWAVHSGGSWSTPGAGLDNVVRAMAPKGAGVVVLGDFTMSGSLRVEHGGIWTGSAWQSFGQGTTSTAIGDGAVMAVVPAGSGAYVAGRFDQAGSLPVGSIARWTGSGWGAMAGGVKAAYGHGQIHAMQLIGTDLYVAGSFDRAGSVAAKNIARWDGSRWHPVGGGLDGDALAMTTLDGKLYVGGSFALAGTVVAGGLARFDPATGTWSKVGNAPIYDHDVMALAILNGRYLVVGGTFNGFNYGGRKIVESLYGMAAFDTRAPIDATNPLSGYRLVKGVSRYGAAGWVRTLHVVGNDLYVGGWFDVPGIMRADGSGTPGFPADNLAVWHVDTDTWEPAGNPDAQVYALATAGDRLIAGGWFEAIGDVRASRVAQYDRAARTWTPLGSGLGGGESDFVSAEALAHSPAAGLWVGGSFAAAGGAPSANVAQWRGAFGPAPRPTLAVGRAGAGAVTSEPAGIACGTDCSQAFAPGTRVTLRATPAAGAVFTGWGGACAGNGACTVTLDGSRTVTATFAAAPLVPTTLTSAAPSGPVAFGAAARISGVLKRTGATTTLPGRRVTLQHRATATAPWATAGTGTTSRTGTVTFTVKPTARRYYRLVYAGAPGKERPAASPARTVLVAPKVAMAVSSASVKRGATVTFSGSVAPAHARKKVVLQRFTSGAWRPVRTVTLSAASGYRTAVKMTSSVDYTWRVFWPGDADHVAAASAARKVTVR